MPFESAAFLRTFAEYNDAVWPAQPILAAIALVACYLALRPGAGRHRVPLALALLWAWAGVVYHAAFFTAINPLAWLFGALFVLEAAMLADVGRRGSLRFRADRSPRFYLGGALVLFALAIYPMTGALAGHWYPAAPTFGTPCPLTIFTLGVLLWSADPVPWRLLVVPAVWVLVGSSAALMLGMTQDLALAVAGVAALPALWWGPQHGHDRRPALDARPPGA